MKELVRTNHVVAFLPDRPAALGHVRVQTINEKKFLHELNEEELHEFTTLSNTLSTLLFEMLNAHGTNIIFTEKERLTADIIARFNDDGLNLMWTPKKAEPSELDDAQKAISDAITLIEHQLKSEGQVEEKNKEPEDEEPQKESEEKQENIEEKKEPQKNVFTDLRLRALRRLP